MVSSERRGQGNCIRNWRWQEVMDQIMRDVSFQKWAFCLGNTWWIIFLLRLLPLDFVFEQFLYTEVFHFYLVILIILLFVYGFRDFIPRILNIPSFFFYYFHGSTILYLNFCNTWDTFWHAEWDKMRSRFLTWLTSCTKNIYIYISSSFLKNMSLDSLFNSIKILLIYPSSWTTATF